MDSTNQPDNNTKEQVVPSNQQNPVTVYKPIKIESVSKTSLKSSQEKSFRKLVHDSIPNIAAIIDSIWPKKATLLFSRQKNYTNVYFVNDEPCFLQIKDEAVVPHIKLLHKCKL